MTTKLKSKKLRIIKIFLFILGVSVISTFLIFLFIRGKELEMTNHAIESLKVKNPELILIGNCFNHLYEADNSFKYYTLSYDSVNYANYLHEIDSLTQTLDTLKSSFEKQSKENRFIDQADTSISKKVDISASFIRLKRLTDSLLYIAVSIDSVKIKAQKSSKYVIRKFDPAKLKTMIDTMSIFSTTEKKKQGIFGKIKTFIAGGTEQVTTQQQMSIKTKDSLSIESPDSTSLVSVYTDIINDNTDRYYQKQLKTQKRNRDRLEAKEKSLVLMNSQLMATLKNLLNILNFQIQENNDAIKVAALADIAGSTKRLNHTTIESITLIILMILAIGWLIRQLNQQESIERNKLISHLEESEEKYRNLIESATDSIFIIKNGMVEYANQVLTKISGYSQNEVLGKPFLNFVSVNERSRILEFYEKRLNDESAPFSYESIAVLKDKSEIPVEVTTSIFKYYGENAELVFLRDIRERKLADLKIMESKISFENLFENSPVSIWEEDITEVIHEIEKLKHNGVSDFEVYFNEHPEQLIQFSALIKILRINKETLALYQAKTKDEMFGNIKRIFLHERLNVFKYELIALANGKTKIEYQTKIKSLDGKVLDVIIKMFTHEVEKKQIAYITTVDVSKLSAAEAEIRKLNEGLENRVKERTAQLEAVNHDLESFAYSVSHDLRTPLRHIDGFTQIIKSSIPPQLPEIDLYFDKVKDAATKMSKMIDDLLTFSRLGRKSISKSNVDLNEMVEKIIRQLSPDYENRQVEWKTRQLPVIQGDYNLIQMAFENLISNALKFTSKNEKSIIEIGPCKKSDKCSIYIKDNGIGFDMKYYSKLFGVFQRLVNQDEFEGTGIGLANVKQIIQKHGGNIRAEGELNKGATFYLNF